MSGCRVLVVDDNPLVLEAVEHILRRAGYVVETTSEVFGLPIRIGKFRPDVILLDFDLPALTGDKLASNLAHVRAAKDCKIVFHSAEDEGRLQRAVEETGAAGYIPKGLGRPEFLLRMRALEPEANG